MQPEAEAAEAAAAARDARPADLVVTSVDTLEGAARLAPAWRALAEACPWSTTFQRPEWVLAFARHHASERAGGALLVLAARARRTGALVGLLPLARSGGEGGSVWTIAGTGPSDVLDVLALPERAPEAARALLTHLAARADWDALELHELREGSPLLDAARAGAAGALAADAAHSVRLVLDLAAAAGRDGAPAHDALARVLPPSWARRVRRERLRAARLGLRVTTAPQASASEHVARWRALHEARWRARGGASAIAPWGAFLSDAARALCASERARVVELVDAAGEPRASYLVLVERDRLALYLGGFDPRVARHSPLVVLLAEVIERAAQEGLREIDFLRGAEPYKYRWGATERPQRRVRVERAPAAARGTDQCPSRSQAALDPS